SCENSIPPKSITPIFIPSPVYPSPQQSQISASASSTPYLPDKISSPSFLICHVPIISPTSSPTSVVGVQARGSVAYKLGSACLIKVVSFSTKNCAKVMVNVSTPAVGNTLKT